MIKTHGHGRLVDQNDSLVMTVKAALSGHASINEGNDTLRGTGGIVIVGTAALTEGDDFVYERTGRYRRVVLNNILTAVPVIS